MKSYREAFVLGRGRKGLNQEELLHRMGEVDPEYSQRFSHATVSRWESGATRPTVERLQTFGRALNLTDEEVEGLILLAGLSAEEQGPTGESASSEKSLPLSAAKDEDLVPETETRAGSESGMARGLPGDLARFFLFRFVVPGLLIAGFHYFLSFLGWNNTWMPVICVAFAFLVVLGQGLVLPDRSAGLRDFYWVSVFFVLTTPLLQFALLGMDHYNFHLLVGYGTMLPYMLALLTNLVLAWSAGLMFHLLRRWRYRNGTTVGGTVTGAASVTIPPLGVVYAVVLVITNFSVTVQLSVIFAVLPLAFSLMLFFRDTGVHFTEQDRRMLFQVMVTAACVSSAVGIAVIMSIYLSPDFPSVLPDHNLVRSWELDFGALGYTREEALDRVNLGYMWHAMCLLIYMTCVVGGRLFVEVHRLGRANYLAAVPSGSDRSH